MHATATSTKQVGEIAAEDGAFAAAVQGQKRLIMEHAVALHTFLLVDKATLEAGYATEVCVFFSRFFRPAGCILKFNIF
jgi:hypothetical protein